MNENIIYGNDMLLYYKSGSTTYFLGGQTGLSLDFSVDMRERTSKLSGVNKEYYPGKNNYTIKLDGFAVFTGVTGSNKTYKDIWNFGQDHTLIDWVYGKSEGTPLFDHDSASFTRSGKAYIQSISENPPQDGDMTYSVTLQVTGPVTTTNG
jgi:predicted secreted protein